MPQYAEGDAVEVTVGPYAWFRGFVGARVEGADDHVVVVLNVYDRRVAVILRDDELGPGDGDGRGGVREPKTPRGPSDSHAAAIELT